MQHKVFEKQLEDVRSETVRNLVIKSLDTISEKFFHAGASSTGKYHPDYTAGDGGLVRHTMSVEYFAKFPDESPMLLFPDIAECIISLLLPDWTGNHIPR